MIKAITISLSILLFTSNSGTLTGKWRLIQYKDLTLGQIENEPSQYNNVDVLTFDFVDNDSLGTFNGKTVYNGTYGEYILKPNKKIKVTLFGGTKINETDWGAKFWTRIRMATSYNIRKDTLNILYDNDSRCMVFVKR